MVVENVTERWSSARQSILSRNLIRASLLVGRILKSHLKLKMMD